LIHFYNSDGFVHYVSEVLQGADCRVADVVRSLEDITRGTVGLLPESVEPGEFRRIQSPGPHQIPFAEEAVRVALALPTWLNNIWMNSPLRDSSIWTGERTRPPGVLSGIDDGQVTLTPGGLKARWESDRLRRRRAWKADRVLLPLGVQV
jgi:hypothetical protein